MIALTIGTGEYYTKLAHHAAQAVEKMTGLETVILGDEQFKSSGLRYSHHLKLRIFDIVEHENWWNDGRGSGHRRGPSSGFCLKGHSRK